MKHCVVKNFKYLICTLLLVITTSYAGSPDKPSAPPCPPKYTAPTAHPFYMGALFGYGNTDWDQLVSKVSLSNFDVNLATPIGASDSGIAWGFFAGYQFSSVFALELSYVWYPDTRVRFLQPFNFYNNIPGILSKTQAFTIVGKFFVPIYRHIVLGYADAGATFTHRDDILLDTTHVGPTFGLGVLYNVTSRVLMELSFQYNVGFGKSTAKPANFYIPFLYSLVVRVGYRL